MFDRVLNTPLALKYFKNNLSTAQKVNLFLKDFFSTYD